MRCQGVKGKGRTPNSGSTGGQAKGERGSKGINSTTRSGRCVDSGIMGASAVGKQLQATARAGGRANSHRHETPMSEVSLRPVGSKNGGET